MNAGHSTDTRLPSVLAWVLFLAGLLAFLAGAFAAYGFAHASPEPRLGFVANATGMLLCVLGYFSVASTGSEKNFRIATRAVLVWCSLGLLALVEFAFMDAGTTDYDWAGIPSEREVALWRGLTGLLALAVLGLFELRVRQVAKRRTFL